MVFKAADSAKGQQGQRIHGQPAAPEFLPRRPRPRGRYRNPVSDLSDARGCGSSSNTFVVVRSNRSAALGDPLSAVFFLSLWLPTANHSIEVRSLMYLVAI